MRVLKITVIVLFSLVLLFLIISIFLPKEFKVEESVLIKAPVEKIFTMINNTKEWEKWSPFIQNGQSMKISYEGPEAGVGAIIKWEDEQENGKLIFKEVVPNGLISGELSFENNLKSTMNWYFENSNEGTLLVWNIIAKDLTYPFQRWLSLFASKMIRPDLQKGLSNIKDLYENQKAKPTKWLTSEVRVKNVDSFYALTIKDSCYSDYFQVKFGEIYNTLLNYISENKIEQISYPFCFFYKWNIDDVSVFEVGVPIKSEVKTKGRITFVEKAGTRVVYASQFGPYESTTNAHDAIEIYTKENNLQISGYPWEVYITDTKKELDTAKWETQIFYPIK